MYLAHRAEDSRERTVLEHGRNVAELCAMFFMAELTDGVLEAAGKEVLR